MDKRSDLIYESDPRFSTNQPTKKDAGLLYAMRRDAGRPLSKKRVFVRNNSESLQNQGSARPERVGNIQRIWTAQTISATVFHTPGHFAIAFPENSGCFRECLGPSRRLIARSSFPQTLPFAGIAAATPPAA
jgi:hypothetical protein